MLDPRGELVIAAAMDVLDGSTAEDVEPAWPAVGEWLFLDCNPPAPVLGTVLAKARVGVAAAFTVASPFSVRPDVAAGLALA